MNDVAAPISPWPSRLFQIFAATYIVLIGLAFALVLLFGGAPSFWFLPAAFLFALSGFAWLRPRLGASFSIPFSVLFLLLILSLKPWSWPSKSKGIAVLVILLLAVTLCVVQIRRTKLAIPALATALVSLLICFAVDRIFTNVPHVITLTMDWTQDGTTPWTDPAKKSPSGEIPVLIYTAVPNGYCYDAVFSEELRKHLIALKKNSIKVEYNEFMTFGKPTGQYNIRSVEGMMINRGRRAIIPNKDGYGGIMMIPTAGMPETYVPRPCPR